MLLTSVSMRQSPHLHIPDFTHLHIPAPTHHSLTNSTPMGWGGGRVGQSYQSHGTYTNSPHTRTRNIIMGWVWWGRGGDGSTDIGMRKRRNFGIYKRVLALSRTAVTLNLESKDLTYESSAFSTWSTVLPCENRKSLASGPCPRNQFEHHIVLKKMEVEPHEHLGNRKT